MIIIKKYLSFGLTVVLIICSFITPFISSVATTDGSMVIAPTTVVTLNDSVTPAQRVANWTKTGGNATVSTENGISTICLNGKNGGQLFTNTFTLEKNNTYKISFDVKIGSETRLSSTYNGVTNPEGIDFVIQDFGSLDKNSVASYRSYIEGTTDYAHAYKGNGNKKTH